jgi:hypothetical protein
MFMNDSSGSQYNPSVTSKGSSLHKVQKVTALVLVVCGIFFAVVGLSAVWGVLGDDSGEVVWRSLVSLGIIGFTALVVNVGARLYEDKRS